MDLAGDVAVWDDMVSKCGGPVLWSSGGVTGDLKRSEARHDLTSTTWAYCRPLVPKPPPSPFSYYVCLGVCIKLPLAIQFVSAVLDRYIMYFTSPFVSLFFGVFLCFSLPVRCTKYFFRLLFFFNSGACAVYILFIGKGNGDGMPGHIS